MIFSIDISEEKNTRKAKTRKLDFRKNTTPYQNGLSVVAIISLYNSKVCK